MADERVPRSVLPGVRHEGGGVLKLYLDCDTGVDDALALAYLLATPSVSLLGIGTCNGNTSAVQAARNTLGLLSLAGRPDIPVSIGEGAFRRGAETVHGDNGVGGVALPDGGAADPRSAVELLKDLARANPGELHVLVTGPCTNLAAALTEMPEITDMVASVTVMGGAVRIPGNVTPHAEANIHDDPTAAAAVLAAGWPVTLVPLDVTMRHRWTEGDRAALRAGGTGLHEALADMVPVYFDFYEPELGVREIPLHDPLAAAIAVGDLTPSDAPQLPLRVDLEGAVREDASAPSRVRVVLALGAPGGPAILRRILGIA
ncbi:nucleoside hydrolase [Actinoplanes sp. NPDC051513]|uniref:nucleoside hydrolase n=1 Tax=Actinoplanes sp. NPDC051513 TaxID=3363908 RepID=UPI0037AA773C